jgi:hypothetical protein
MAVGGVARRGSSAAANWIACQKIIRHHNCLKWKNKVGIRDRYSMISRVEGGGWQGQRGRANETIDGGAVIRGACKRAPPGGRAPERPPTG